MDSHVDPQDFGELIGTVKALNTSVASLQSKVEDLTRSMDKAKGGWVGIATTAGVVGGVIEALHYVKDIVKGH